MRGRAHRCLTTPERAIFISDRSSIFDLFRAQARFKILAGPDSGLTLSRLCPLIRRVSAAKPSKLVFVLALACLFWAGSAVGGPPLLTDDPDTPGPNHWEINVAEWSQEINRAWLLATPLLDMNYGVGDHIHLKYQVQFNELAPPRWPPSAILWRALNGVFSIRPIPPGLRFPLTRSLNLFIPPPPDRAVWPTAATTFSCRLRWNTNSSR